ncbi:MAG: FAD-dependent oxidoreductase [Halobacteriales archaeon]|nr:FAD-dependent oxidoreductase [Halobacteriales archaeon]
MGPRRLAGKHMGSFRWGRRGIPFSEGDTIASALLAAGQDVLSRSIKYHRPRGYACGIGKCASCLVTLDGKPSVRACMTLARAGMQAQAQNCWPSAQRDVYALTERFMPADFDPQRTLTRPRFLIPVYHAVVRHMAGLGKAPRDAAPPRIAAVAQEKVPLVVVGAGPAGLAAAVAAGASGVEVLLVDEAPWPGGRLRREGAMLRGGRYDGRTPAQALGTLRDALSGSNVRSEQEASASGIYPGKLLAVASPRRLREVTAQAVVLAPGAPEGLSLFGNNDRPGVMSASAAGQLLQHGILPGERVVLVGADARAVGIARSLQQAGAQVEAVLAPEEAMMEGLPRRDASLVEVEGAQRVRAVKLSDGTRIACDVVVLAEPRRPAIELFQQAGCALAEQGGALAPRCDGARTSVPGVFAAGDALRPGSLEDALAGGERAGLEAARALGRKVDEARLAALGAA